MNERPEEAIKWLKLFLWHKDRAKNISKTLLNYITQLEAENEKLKSDLAQWHNLYDKRNEWREPKP